VRRKELDALHDRALLTGKTEAEERLRTSAISTAPIRATNRIGFRRGELGISRTRSWRAAPVQ